ncbi:MAG: hypothetical protein ACD_75C01193G0002 [uncultured bacterium]|nr:MAG: hypothetical protein ACD_75C01193G0002 [uncultured bacterium]
MRHRLAITERRRKIADKTIDLVDRGTKMNRYRRIVLHLADGIREKRLDVIAFQISPNIFKQSAQGFVPLDQMHAIALVAERQGCGHPGNAAANNQSRMGNPHRGGAYRHQPFGFGNHHIDDFDCLLRRILVVMHMTPGALLPDIGQLEQKLIQPHLANGILEERGMGTRRTGGNDDAV